MNHKEEEYSLAKVIDDAIAKGRTERLSETAEFVSATWDALRGGVTFEALWEAFSTTVADFSNNNPQHQPVAKALAVVRSLKPSELVWLRQCMAADSWHEAQESAVESP